MDKGKRVLKTKVMKREILFIGKIKHNGDHLFACDWAIGSLVLKSNGAFIYVVEEDELGNIIREYEVEVIPETIGQFTGLTDRNGVKIFEDDIVKIVEDGDKKTDNRPEDFNYGDVALILFDSRYCQFGVYNNSIDEIESIGNLVRPPWFNFIEIIGNIHDNPELLK